MTTTIYEDWKKTIETLNVSEFKFYFPTSENFMPVTNPVFHLDGKVYSVKTRAFENFEQVEEFLNNANNIALFYAGQPNGMDKIHVRFAQLDSDYLTPISLEEFVESNQHRLYPENKYGTFNGLQEQMKTVNSLGIIMYCTIKQNEDGITKSIAIEKLPTDGTVVFV